MHTGEFVGRPMTHGSLRGSIHHVPAQALLSYFSQYLDRKLLVKEGDREQCRGMLRGYLVLGKLAGAVQKEQRGETEQYLQELGEVGIMRTLDQGGDASLDTLLHVAARGTGSIIVRLLLSKGANPNLWNFAGDRPSQLRMFPHVGSSARACRAAEYEHAANVRFSYRQLHVGL
mmetsp:Transcript_96714/g.301167  ORF Transcript_96714/g.301167 Transcript_96714/m.301167 type:complete len:174 (+) Transcript_96714:1323-1844(+)